VSTEPEGGSAGEGEPTVQGGAVGGCCDRRRGRRGEGAVVVAVRGRAGAGEGGGGGQLAGGVPGLLHRPGRDLKVWWTFWEGLKKVASSGLLGTNLEGGSASIV
jgi:hypothetical protein